MAILLSTAGHGRSIALFFSPPSASIELQKLTLDLDEDLSPGQTSPDSLKPHGLTQNCNTSRRTPLRQILVYDLFFFLYP